MEPQLIPVGLLETVPLPEPVLLTLKANIFRLSAAATALAASTIPLPQVEVVQLLPPGKGRAVLCRTLSTWAGVREGLTENIRETTPVTGVVEKLVPVS